MFVFYKIKEKCRYIFLPELLNLNVCIIRISCFPRTPFGIHPVGFATVVINIFISYPLNGLSSRFERFPGRRRCAGNRIPYAYGFPIVFGIIQLFSDDVIMVPAVFAYLKSAGSLRNRQSFKKKKISLEYKVIFEYAFCARFEIHLEYFDGHAVKSWNMHVNDMCFRIIFLFPPSPLFVTLFEKKMYGRVRVRRVSNRATNIQWPYDRIECEYYLIFHVLYSKYCWFDNNYRSLVLFIGIWFEWKHKIHRPIVLSITYYRRTLQSWAIIVFNVVNQKRKRL